MKHPIMTHNLIYTALLFSSCLALIASSPNALAADESLPSSVLQQQAFERGVQVGLQQGQKLCPQQPASQPRAVQKTVIGNQYICQEDDSGRKKGNVVRTTLYSDGTSVRAIVAQGISMRGYSGFFQSCESKAEEMNSAR